MASARREIAAGIEDARTAVVRIADGLQQADHDGRLSSSETDALLDRLDTIKRKLDELHRRSNRLMT